MVIRYRLGNEVCGIGPLKERCNLYCVRGTELDDPDALLEGTGKGIRHIKVASVTEVGVGKIRRLLRAARRLDAGDAAAWSCGGIGSDGRNTSQEREIPACSQVTPEAGDCPVLDFRSSACHDAGFTSGLLVALIGSKYDVPLS